MLARRHIIAGTAALGAALLGAFAASAFIAGVFDHQAALGAPMFSLGATHIYPPTAIFEWRHEWRGAYPKPFAVADLILIGSWALGTLALALALKDSARAKPFGLKAWADFNEVSEAGLFATQGVVLGKFDGELLCYDGPEHHLLVGASRSGKGRGHVVPTLLTWPHSALVLDVKGELAHGDPRHGFPGTAGYRAALGQVRCFAPTRADSVRFNPLFEVRRGANEVRDVQNIVEIIVDPAGDGRHQDFWDRSAKAVLNGVILHVLYCEPVERKTLAVVREKLAHLDETAREMTTTLHRRHPITNEPQVHPEVEHAATSYQKGEVRMRSGIKATAESFFGLFADELVAANTATSDFRIGDLMCADKPMTLYLQPPPSDAMRLAPLTRLFINQTARALMEHQTEDGFGRRKRRPLLLVLDEFPALGKMVFFETMMGAMAGYGLKAYLVCQSLNHLSRAYGRDNVILDNVHVVTAFAAADVDTAKSISAMAGEIYELRAQESLKRPGSLFFREGTTTMREERRPLLLPGDVRGLKRDEELIFVSGAKPIRAKKLRFDTEGVFRARLMPAPPEPSPHAPVVHDWIDVAPLGFLEKDAAGTVRVATTRRAKPKALQPDLPGLSISERARAGVSGPHPSTLAGADAASESRAESDVGPRLYGL
jgi:type IV secretion system protein VirD4